MEHQNMPMHWQRSLKVHLKKPITVHKKRRDVGVHVMVVLNKIIFYFSRLYNIYIIFWLVIGVGWGYEINVSHSIGFLILLLIFFYSKLIIKLKLLLMRLISYIVLVLMFYPNFLFNAEYYNSYENMIFYYSCFLTVLDIWLFTCSNFWNIET